MDEKREVFGHRSHRVWRWLRRAVIALVLGIVVLAGLAFAYQTIATEMDRRTFPPPGQLVDVGGHRLHLNCSGEGSPAVILEIGQGALSSDWGWVQPQVAKATQVCSYDRAGIAWSDSGPLPRDANSITKDLHALLAEAGVPPPYVLAGHSYGGLYARAYAAAHPDEVSGVVLVDSSHPDQWNRLPGGPEQFDKIAGIYRIARVLALFGGLRLVNYSPLDPDLPVRQAAERKAMADTAAFVAVAADEFDASPVTTATLVTAGTLGSKPLFVLSATEHDAPPDVEALAAILQDELAALQRFGKGSDNA